MSADPRGYYRALGVATSATSQEIRHAYRMLAKAMHPDVNQGRDTTAEFQFVNEAYAVLSDPAQRAAYDRTRDAEPLPHVGASQRRPSSDINDIEPYHCVDCNRVSPHLRHIKYTQVVSYLFGAHRSTIWGIFCDACASKRIRKASLITGAVGWLSTPGVFLSAYALVRNLTGGERQHLVNLEVSLRQAVYFAMRGDRLNASLAARDAQVFAEHIRKGFWNDNEKRRAREVAPIIEQVLAMT